MNLYSSCLFLMLMMIIKGGLIQVFKKYNNIILNTGNERREGTDEDTRSRNDKKRNVNLDDETNEPWLSSIKRRRKSMGPSEQAVRQLLSSDTQPSLAAIENSDTPRDKTPNPATEVASASSAHSHSPEESFESKYLKLKTDLMTSHDHLEPSKLRLEMLKSVGVGNKSPRSSNYLYFSVSYFSCHCN